jgi:hypothetical protein
MKRKHGILGCLGLAVLVLIPRVAAQWQHARVQKTDKALAIAVETGDIRAARVALQAGADIRRAALLSNEPPTLSFFQLIWSTIHGGNPTYESGPVPPQPLLFQAMLAPGHQAELIDLILSCGISPDSIDSPGDTALGYAANIGYPDACTALLKHGAHVDLGDSRGITPLMVAVASQRGNKMACVQALLAAGANVNAVNATGQTALFFAIHDAAMMKLLLTHGANAQLLDRGKYSALDVALGHESIGDTSQKVDPRCIALLRKTGSPSATPHNVTPGATRK